LPALLGALVLPQAAQAAPEVLDPALDVRTAVSGLSQPVTMAFIGDNAMLVTEKASGKVQHVVNGAGHVFLLRGL
jgi:glucose/arabinose dehydrogenase